VDQVKHLNLGLGSSSLDWSNWSGGRSNRFRGIGCPNICSKYLDIHLEYPGWGIGCPNFCPQYPDPYSEFPGILPNGYISEGDQSDRSRKPV
jgi:hypothetical protein